MASFFNRQPPMATHFLLEVGRETIVEDCLQKIIHMSKKAG